jgi:hypothetical protein
LKYIENQIEAFEVKRLDSQYSFEMT